MKNHQGFIFLGNTFCKDYVYKRKEENHKRMSQKRFERYMKFLVSFFGINERGAVTMNQKLLRYFVMRRKKKIAYG